MFFCCPLQEHSQGCLISGILSAREGSAQAGRAGAQGCGQADGTTDPGSAAELLGVEDKALSKRGRERERKDDRNNSSVPRTGVGPAHDLGKTLRATLKPEMIPDRDQGHQGDSDPATVTPAQTLASSRLQSFP